MTGLTSLSLGEAPIEAHWGYVGLAIAVFFFGSNYLPVKQYETGDGMFFQLILCLAIWSVSFVVACLRNFPQFYALPMLGGFLWATGNVNTVPIIKCIGLGLGMLFWGTTSLVVGWANARFGWFGIHPQVPSHTIMNYVGVGLAASSALFYLFIKTNTSQERESIQETEPLIESINDSQDRNINDNNDFFDRLNHNVKRIIGTVLAVFSGTMYGLNFTPTLYVIDNYTNASQNGLDYVFSMYTGILISSIFYFTIYAVYKRNLPFVNPKAILPGLVSGWMWGIANTAFFVANSALSQSISFPIVSSGPPVIAMLYGVFLYKEVKGTKNFMILISGFSFAIVGSVLCGLSK